MLEKYLPSQKRNTFGPRMKKKGFKNNLWEKILPNFFCHSKPTLVPFIQSLKRPNATRQRLLKYLVPAILLSLAFNVPKFFEATVVYDGDDGDDGETGGGGNGTEGDSPPAPRIGVTDMRKSPAYSAYNNWSRFILLGLLPFALLVFFNAMIYRCQVFQNRNVFSFDNFVPFPATSRPARSAARGGRAWPWSTRAASTTEGRRCSHRAPGWRHQRGNHIGALPRLRPPPLPLLRRQRPWPSPPRLLPRRAASRRASPASSPG